MRAALRFGRFFFLFFLSNIFFSALFGGLPVNSDLRVFFLPCDLSLTSRTFRQRQSDILHRVHDFSSSLTYSRQHLILSIPWPQKHEPCLSWQDFQVHFGSTYCEHYCFTWHIRDCDRGRSPRRRGIYTSPTSHTSGRLDKFRTGHHYTETNTRTHDRTKTAKKKTNSTNTTHT
jgi:hypothetical protein